MTEPDDYLEESSGRDRNGLHVAVAVTVAAGATAVARWLARSVTRPR